LLSGFQFCLFRYSLLRFQTTSTEWLEKVEADGFALNHVSYIKYDEPKRPLIDIWAEPNRYRKHADVLVAPEFLDTFLVLLKRHGVSDVQIIKKDI
uniref:Propep_M14 domain-containing protein n=1 Tax=Gongylonema pulchrum TaxID=637853 RepID=A0A183DZT1_9BILA